MRHVPDRPAGPEFDHWLKKAASAREKILESWAEALRQGSGAVWKAAFDEAVWKDLREVFLYGAFHRKCAYCESTVGETFTAHVEHFRPKGGVTADRRQCGHPGYFWLAYEWWNLLLACANCNGGHTDPIGDSHPGKHNEFPVRKSHVAEPSADPAKWAGDLDTEDHLLLNPYFDKPSDHIEFDPETGYAIGKTDRGKATIDICDLNRPSLTTKRMEMIKYDLVGRAWTLLRDRATTLDSLVPQDAEMSLWCRGYITWLFEDARVRQ